MKSINRSPALSCLLLCAAFFLVPPGAMAQKSVLANATTCPLRGIDESGTDPQSFKVDLGCDGVLETLGIKEVLQQESPYLLNIRQITISDAHGKTIWRSPKSAEYSGQGPYITSTEHYHKQVNLVGDIDDDGKSELVISISGCCEETDETRWGVYRWTGKDFTPIPGRDLLREAPAGSGRFVWKKYEDSKPGTTWIESLNTKGENLVAGIKNIDAKRRVVTGEAIVILDKNGLHVVRWLKPLKKAR